MAVEELAPPVPRVAQSGSRPDAVWLSVERMLYAVALGIGLWVRLWNLGHAPLSPWEASNSWPAWLAANGMIVQDAPTPTSALFYVLQWLLFWAGVNADAGARFVSALAGAALVVLPWWWRELLGRRTALFASYLIALDAWLVGFARLADGASVALMVAMLLLVALSQVVAQPASLTWKRIAAAGLGLVVVSGPMGWNLLPIAVWWGWLHRRELTDAEMGPRQWLVWGGGAALIGATMLFARLDGLAWVASGMSVWLTQFDGGSAGPLLPAITGGYAINWPWLRLWADAPLLLPFGLVGLVVLAIRSARSPQDGRFLSLCYVWLAWGAILWALPGRSPLALPVLGLPLLFLTAFALDAMAGHVPQNLDWREAGAIVLTLSILLVSGAIWLAALLATRTYDAVLAQAALVIFGLAIMILAAFTLWANRRDALWLAATLLAVLLFVLTVRSAWRLNFGDVLSEPAGWQARLAHPEVRMLATDMETLSSHRSGDPYQLPVQVQVSSYVTQGEQTVPARPDPVVGWQLRNMRNLTWVASPQVAEDTVPLPLVVTPVSDEEATAQMDLPSSYAGSRYHVDAWWLPSLLAAQEAAPVDGGAGFLQRTVVALQPWWRWYVYRDTEREPVSRDLILWAPLEQANP